MSNQIQNPNDKNDKKYDLVERTAKFGEEIIEFAQTLPQKYNQHPSYKPTD